MSSSEIRHCYWITAPSAEQRAQLWVQLQTYPHRWLWIGQGAQAQTPAQALQSLGQEYQLLVYDAYAGFDPDAFGALLGTLCAGGALLLFSPEPAQWPQYADPQLQRLAVHDAPVVTGYYLQRLAQLLSVAPEVTRLAAGELPALPTPPIVQRSAGWMTAEQAHALTAIQRCAFGRAWRPLVIQADRGRGKSAVLGLAAAALLAARPTVRIVVSAAQRAAAWAVFAHAGEYAAQLTFCAPDALLQEPPACDLLLIDEAAALPVALLTQLVRRYPRLVLASTVHGYEGSGRGFITRLQQQLQHLTPGWRALTLQQPIRWAEHDPLEALTTRVLLLDAEPASEVVSTGPTQLQRLTPQHLLANEDDLRQLFGLLLLAHYRTTPLDVRHVFDGPNLQLWVLRRQQQIVACAWLALEGGLAPELAEAIGRGQRRVRGHLLAQTLCFHSGVTHAAQQRYGRIVRIAVHPALQRQGLGRQLLQQLIPHAIASGVDALGSSFGASAPLLQFWRALGYQPVRIGTRREPSSGEPALQVLLTLTPAGQSVLEQARQRLLISWPLLLGDELSSLDPQLAADLWAGLDAAVPALSAEQRQWLHGFASEQRPYASVLPELHAWSAYALSRGQLPAALAAVCVQRLWQQRAWSECAQQVAVRGREGVVSYLRRGVAAWLAATECV